MVGSWAPVARRKRSLVKISAATLALVTLAVIAYVVTLRLLERRERRIAPAMIKVENGLLEINDYDAWFEVLPRAIRSALRRGVTDAETILIEVFSAILPDEQWPPPAGSPNRWQWREMVARTAEILDVTPRPTPPKRKGLRVVPASA